jgi:hypothetical protein
MSVVPRIQRQVNIGPWIFAGLMAHAILLVLGGMVALEYQKAQFRQAIEQARESRTK